MIKNHTLTSRQLKKVYDWAVAKGGYDDYSCNNPIAKTYLQICVIIGTQEWGEYMKRVNIGEDNVRLFEKAYNDLFNVRDNIGYVILEIIKIENKHLT